MSSINDMFDFSEREAEIERTHIYGRRYDYERENPYVGSTRIDDDINHAGISRSIQHLREFPDTVPVSADWANEIKRAHTPAYTKPAHYHPIPKGNPTEKTLTKHDTKHPVFRIPTCASMYALEPSKIRSKMEAIYANIAYEQIQNIPIAILNNYYSARASSKDYALLNQVICALNVTKGSTNLLDAVNTAFRTLYMKASTTAFRTLISDYIHDIIVDAYQAIVDSSSMSWRKLDYIMENKYRMYGYAIHCGEVHARADTFRFDARYNTIKLRNGLDCPQDSYERFLRIFDITYIMDAVNQWSAHLYEPVFYGTPIDDAVGHIICPSCVRDDLYYNIAHNIVRVAHIIAGLMDMNERETCRITSIAANVDSRIKDDFYKSCLHINTKVIHTADRPIVLYMKDIDDPTIPNILHEIRKAAFSEARDPDIAPSTYLAPLSLYFHILDTVYSISHEAFSEILEISIGFHNVAYERFEDDRYFNKRYYSHLNNAIAEYYAMTYGPKKYFEFVALLMDRAKNDIQKDPRDFINAVAPINMGHTYIT